MYAVDRILSEFFEFPLCTAYLHSKQLWLRNNSSVALKVDLQLDAKTQAVSLAPAANTAIDWNEERFAVARIRGARASNFLHL